MASDCGLLSKYVDVHPQLVSQRVSEECLPTLDVVLRLI